MILNKTRRINKWKKELNLLLLRDEVVFKGKSEHTNRKIASLKNDLRIAGVSQQGSVEKVMKQTGTRVSVKRDAGRGAKLPGKRISKTGKTYWETRKNRSDAPLKKI